MDIKQNPQIYSLMEVVADIAYIAGTKNYYGGDSRKDISNFIQWAIEFEEQNSDVEWGFDTDDDYIDAIEKFVEIKLSGVTLKDEKEIFFLECLKDLTEFKLPDYPNSVFFKKPNGIIWFEIRIKPTSDKKILYCSFSDIWRFFYDRFGISYHETQDLISGIVLKHTSWGLVQPRATNEVNGDIEHQWNILAGNIHEKLYNSNNNSEKHFFVGFDVLVSDPRLIFIIDKKNNLKIIISSTYDISSKKAREKYNSLLPFYTALCEKMNLTGR